MATIKVGDVVRLKSGGPVMTVEHDPLANPDLDYIADEIAHKVRVTCTWFEGSELRVDRFHPHALMHCEA